jgi:hypothetical protein
MGQSKGKFKVSELTTCAKQPQSGKKEHLDWIAIDLWILGREKIS